jgi:hypothetical protein
MNKFKDIEELKDALKLPEGKFSNKQLEYILLSVNESIAENNDTVGHLTSNDFLTSIYEKLLNLKDIYTLKGNHSNIFIAEYDGVPYGFDNIGNLHCEREPEKVLNERIERSIKGREMIIERHHDIVKKSYEYCKNLNIGDIWCMIGGGSNYSIYFGNHTGYLAELCLSPTNRRFYRTRKPKYLFIPNWEHNDKYFENNFKVDGIKFRTNKKHWANT